MNTIVNVQDTGQKKKKSQQGFCVLLGRKLADDKRPWDSRFKSTDLIKKLLSCLLHIPLRLPTQSEKKKCSVIINMEKSQENMGFPTDLQLKLGFLLLNVTIEITECPIAILSSPI